MHNPSLIEAAFFDLGGTLIGNNQDWIPGARRTIEKLHQRRVRLGIISNTGNLSRPAILDLLPRDFDLGLFEERLVIFSSEVHLEKPDPAIFRLAIKRSRLPAANCLFCTEDPSHIQVAQQLGMETFNVRRPPNSDIGQLVKILVNGRRLPP